jgi:hypothetical protein
MYRVRFNLGRGDRYMMWKVMNLEDKSKQYLDPDEVSLTLINCTLKNNSNRAEEIFLGCNKSVWSWIVCEDVIIEGTREIEGVHIRYNPRVAPYWSENGEDIDGKFFKELKTNNRNVIYDGKNL